MMAARTGVVPRLLLVMAMVLVVTTPTAASAAAFRQSSSRAFSSTMSRPCRHHRTPSTASGPLLAVGIDQHDGGEAASTSTAGTSSSSAVGPAERSVPQPPSGNGGTYTRVDKQTKTKERHDGAVVRKTTTAASSSAAAPSALLLLALLLASALPTSVPAWAASTSTDVAHGAQLFSAECADCHANGGNTMNSLMTLKKDALMKYQGKVTDADQLVNYVSAQRPHIAFDFPTIRSSSDYSDVIEYVLDQAINDKWK